MTQIDVERLTVSFGTMRAVDHLSFTVPSGQVVGFLGPSGAGKTTTLRCLLGLVRPDSGSATVGGCRYADLPHPARTVGAVPESPGFHPRRRAHDHLRTVAAAAGLPARRVEGRGVPRRGGAHRGRAPPGGRLLARHAATTRDRGGTARRPRGAGTRRAHDRVRPG